MQQLIRNDGGQGKFKEVTPPMLEIWDQLLQVGHQRCGQLLVGASCCQAHLSCC